MGHTQVWLRFDLPAAGERRRSALPAAWCIVCAGVLNGCSGGGDPAPSNLGGTGHGTGGTGAASGGRSSGGGGAGGQSGMPGARAGMGGAGMAGREAGGAGAGRAGSSTDGGAGMNGGRVGAGGSTFVSGGAAGAAGSAGKAGAGGSSGAGRGSGVGGAAAGAAGAGGGPPGSGTCGGGSAQASDITIDEAALEQQITGFGVSSAWAGSYANASDPEYLWSTTTGAGLTLLRIRYGDGLAIAQAAAKYGVTVWMTPWGTGNNGSPGGSVTTMQTDPNGCKGTMPVLTDPEQWAKNLVDWIENAKTKGVPIYAVSAENEPDSCGINQTTSYSATQLATWIGGYLGPAMAPLGVKVMAPETMNACGFKTYFSAIQNDMAAWNAVDIFASHEYGCGTLPSEPAISAADKQYWETEVDTGIANGDAPGNGIASALLTVTTIHNDLTKANLNAWHYWWLYCDKNSGCLYDTGTKVWAKRLWAMGNYARFVRPGWKRVRTSGTAPSGVLVSAYIDPTNDSLSIVAINNNSAASNLSFYVSGSAPCVLTPYETSASKNLGSGAELTVVQSRVTVTLSPQSITTFVGKP